MSCTGRATPAATYPRISGTALDDGDEVVGPGDDGIAQHRGVLPEMGVRGAEQAIEVDVA